MGDDEMAVVDRKLSVKCVKRLRVTDCSVMPKNTSGHTQMPAYGIGRKATEYIKEAAQVNGPAVNGGMGMLESGLHHRSLAHQPSRGPDSLSVSVTKSSIQCLCS